MRWIFSTYLPHVFHVLMVMLIMLMALSSNDENLRLLKQNWRMALSGTWVEREIFSCWS